MGSQFKYTIKDKRATLEEYYITPIPTIVLHHVVGFFLDPNIKPNKRNATKPSVKVILLAFTTQQFLETITSWHGQLLKDFQATKLLGKKMRTLVVCYWNER